MPFSFEGAAVRVVTRDGEPWFVLNDVCKILEITNPSMAGGRLKPEEKGVISLPDSTGRMQDATVITEAGFYRLVLRSDKPAADRFQSWVVKEVLPTIRKTGGYGVQAPAIDLNDPAFLRGTLLTYTEKVIALEGQITTLTPKAEALASLPTSRQRQNS